VSESASSSEPPPIFPQIDNEPSDVLFFQPLEQREHIARRALLVPVHVGIERRQGQPAEFYRLAFSSFLMMMSARAS